MGKDFKVKGGNRPLRTRMAAIADGTVIEAGDLVALDGSNLIIKALATSAKVAYAPLAHASGGGLLIEITEGNDFTLKGTMDTAFVAATHRGLECDINAGTQTIDPGGTTYKVIQISTFVNVERVGETTDIEFKINKPLDERA